MSVIVFRTRSEEETIALGRELALTLPRPAAVLLIGNLGAGKTTLAKGIVEGLGAAARDDVSSPTYTLIHDYGAGVFHIDLYRLETEREVAGLGLDDLFDRDDAVVLIEWGERFTALMPVDRIEIRITAEEDGRKLEVAGLLTHEES
ncbi:MAG: tRNA (adenosine(37)-N6)-threonylcarbamoyltransferase complex ATPase subunit type 1 TsaE [Bryobacteraceae bacterium]|nr:tRNA (adenosine(37)-N6)-threonylcarbamoyltransferase complex ATPase subunit type 1 TsaE [Bryobacteraceae bacterium]